ncbi:transketolase family protein, partial [Candidatus Woesearchaeota archaeon]|nr:transketolase family protein [Candidatus Woesearchaeota archaeon]
MRATRDAYGETLASMKDKNIVVLDADLSESTRTRKFAEKHPGRFFDFGIAEANMMSTAAGLATTGKIVFASTFACFASARALDQIRVSICYSNVNVKVCATHAGLTIGEDGATHQALSDIAIMRSMPNLKVFVPADPNETEQIIRWLVKDVGPSYVRLGRNKIPDLHEKFGKQYQTKFTYGRAQKLMDGKDATIIACGYMVEKAMEAAMKL